MIYAYWPKKSIAEWLEKIEVKDAPGPMKIHHGGSGLIWKWKDAFHVLGLTGSFICIHNTGATPVTIRGQGRGVTYHSMQSIFRNILTGA